MQGIMRKILLFSALMFLLVYSVNQALTFNENKTELLELEVGSEKYLVFPDILQMSEGGFIRFICINPETVPYLIIVTIQNEYTVQEIIYSDKANKFGLIRIPVFANQEVIYGLRINGHFLEWSSND